MPIVSIDTTIVEIIKGIRDQLAEVVDRILTTIFWVFDKLIQFIQLMFEYFPYDNYQRAVLLSILAVLGIASLMALFGVASLAPVTPFGGTYGLGSHPNANAVSNANELTVSVGLNTVRESVGQQGTGVAPKHNASTANTLPDTPSGSEVGNDIDGDGIPDQSDGDMDGDGKANAVDDDIDGDNIPNKDDDTPCGDYAECPPHNSTSSTFSFCGNGVCESNMVQTTMQVLTYGQNYFFYNIPYWCLKNNLDTSTLRSYDIYGITYVGVMGSQNLKDNLNTFCQLGGENQLVYSESITNCQQDCLQNNQTHTIMYCNISCYNNEWDVGEEGTDCGGICQSCFPCHCTNGVYESQYNETGIDCTDDIRMTNGCPTCSCSSDENPQLKCASKYCCAVSQANGVCSGKCLLSNYIITSDCYCSDKFVDPECDKSEFYCSDWSSNAGVCTYNGIPSLAHYSPNRDCESICAYGDSIPTQICTLPVLDSVLSENSTIIPGSGVIFR